jgi:hypothetical protein
VIRYMAWLNQYGTAVTLYQVYPGICSNRSNKQNNVMGFG